MENTSAGMELVCENPETYLVRTPGRQGFPQRTNCYLVRDGEGLLVVDTGFDTDEGKVLLNAAFRKLDVSREDVSFFLTHFHEDHVNLLDRIAAPGARVYASRTEVELLRATWSMRFYPEELGRVRREGIPWDLDCEAFYRLVGFGKFDIDRYDVRFLEEGDVVSAGSAKLAAVDTAGHAAGHLSLFDPASGVLFAGDQVLFDIAPCIGPEMFGNDLLGRYIENVEKVAGLPVRTCLQAHGALHDGGFRDRALWLAQHHRDRAAEMLRFAREHPDSTGFELVLGARRDAGGGWKKMSFPAQWCIATTGLATLEYLERSGGVAGRVGPDGLRRYRAC